MICNILAICGNLENRQEHLSEIQKGATQEILITSCKLVLRLAKMLR